jgi:hypothetical protein
MTLAQHLHEQAKIFITAAYARCEGDPGETAKMLGVSRSGLYNWLKRVGIIEKNDNRIAVRHRRIERIKSEAQSPSLGPLSTPAQPRSHVTPLA